MQINDSLKYKLTVTDKFGCNDIDSFSLGELTGITTIEKLQFKIFPNPSNENINIEFNGLEIQKINLNVFIYNSLGEKIYCLENISSEKTVLNKSDFLSGIYFYEIIEIQSGNKTMGKLVFFDK